MTESSRRQHILEALQQYKDDSGDKDTYRAPLRGGMLLPVVQLPLDVPILNVESFRIAPQLEDDERAEFVKAHPESPEAQAIVAELICAVHRNLDELKQNLEEEGQTVPGLISRSGKLINANTRCVLLRQLNQEGRVRTGTIDVAVLPPNVGNAEELELEMVLQQQRDLKDEYRLLNELLMIKKLFVSGMTDEAIGKRRRLRATKSQTSGQRVKERRQILDLMERARRLFDPPQLLTTFDSKVDKLENWSALLSHVHGIDKLKGSSAGDRHIRSWLLAYMSGADSVRKLRNAVGPRVERQIVAGLRENETVRDLVDTEVRSAAARRNGDGDSTAPEGLDVLGVDASPSADGDGDGDGGNDRTVEALLNIVTTARQAGDQGVVEAGDGRQFPARDVMATFKVTVEKARRDEERRSKAGNRLTRPAFELQRVAAALKVAIDALGEVRDDIEFESQRPAVIDLAQQVSSLATSALVLAEESAATSG